MNLIFPSEDKLFNYLQKYDYLNEPITKGTDQRLLRRNKIDVKGILTRNPTLKNDETALNTIVEKINRAVAKKFADRTIDSADFVLESSQEIKDAIQEIDLSDGNKGVITLLISSALQKINLSQNQSGSWFHYCEII